MSLNCNRAPLKGISSGNARFTATLCGTVSTYEYLQRGIDQGESQRYTTTSGLLGVHQNATKQRTPPKQIKWHCCTHMKPMANAMSYFLLSCIASTISLRSGNA